MPFAESPRLTGVRTLLTSFQCSLRDSLHFVRSINVGIEGFVAYEDPHVNLYAQKLAFIGLQLVLFGMGV